MSDIESRVIEELVVKMSGTKKAERKMAEAAIRRLGPTAVQDLLAILVRERAKRAKKRKIFGAIIICYFAFILLIGIFAHNFGLFGSIGGMTGAIIAAFAATQTQRNVALLLTEMEDPRTVGALAEALEFQDQKVGKVAEDALISLLPRVKASDTDLLDAHQRACLYRALNRKNSELALAILAALEQVGDGNAVPYVQKLADGHGIAATSSSVREAAQQCLPYLQQLAAAQQARQTLLRASDAAEAPTTAPDILLRPASGVTPADPHELLRAATATEIPMSETSDLTPSVTVRTASTAQTEEADAVLRVGQG